MKNLITLLAFSLLTSAAISQIRVEDYYRPSDGKDMSKAINRALQYIDEKGHGTLEFIGTKNYFVADECELPRYSKSGRRIIIINGKESTKAELERLDPESVESMEVIKDGTVIEKYGIKAKNGVVIIKLKETDDK